MVKNDASDINWGLTVQKILTYCNTTSSGCDRFYLHIFLLYGLGHMVLTAPLTTPASKSNVYLASLQLGMSLKKTASF